jgi:hypothetical protein
VIGRTDFRAARREKKLSAMFVQPFRVLYASL